MLANMDEKRWASVLDVNLAAEMRINEYLLNNDVPGGLGQEARIVGIASTSGVAGNKGQTNYAASKAGVIGLVRAMGADPRLAERGITVNAVAPGFIESDMTESLADDLKEQYLSRIPARRFGRAEEVASLVAFLAGDEAAYINGQTIAIDGGMVMR